MSQFSNQLQASLEAAGLTQTDVCEKADISQGQMSRYVNGENRPEQEFLERLLKLFDEKNRTLLLVAYLNDGVPPKYRRLVNVSPGEPKTAYAAEESPPYRSQMPRRLRAAFDFLGERSISDPRAATMVTDFAELVKSTAQP